MARSTSARPRLVLGTLLFIATIGGAVSACNDTKSPTASGDAAPRRIHSEQSPSWSEEPGGFTTITDYGFDDQIPASNGAQLGTSRWYINYNTDGNASQISHLEPVHVHG